jgi:phosphoglycolate phosphatase
MLRRDPHEAIVWDLDGTLVDSAVDLGESLNTLLNEQGQHALSIDSVRPMIGDGVAKLIERGFRAAGVTLDPEALEALVPPFMEIYNESCTVNTRLAPYAREALLAFYNAGALQGLCTNKPYLVTTRILHDLDIIGFFDSIVGGDTTAEKKPHPLPLQTCLEELGVEPEQAVMIGDSVADVGSARAVGMPIILVSDGYSAVPTVSLGGDYVVEDLRQLPGCLLPESQLRQSA